MSNLPPAGWYPAPHANNEQRYWDGAQWVEGVPQPASDLSPQVAVPTPVFDATGRAPGSAENAKKSRKKGWIIGCSIAAGVLLIGGIGSALGAGSDKGAEAAPQTSTAADVVDDAEDALASPTEDPIVMVAVPDMVGLTATDAVNAMVGAGLQPPAVTSFKDPLAKVLSSDPPAGTEVEEGTQISITVEEKPALTMSQENALQTAQSYLSMMGFSRTGLMGQLEFEGYSTEDATFAVDSAGADWSAEAAEKAKSYLDMMAFSRQGLYDQLAFEGFSPEEIEAGLAAVGY